MIERLRYFAGLFNWGDDVNPVLYAAITGKEPVRMHVLDKTPVEHLMMCGSVLNFANEHSVIWGTGFMHRQSTLEGCSMDMSKQIHAVRGPLTEKRLGELGIEVDVPYGDPSMLLKKFNDIDTPDHAKYKFGVVPHYIDKMRVEGWPDDILKNFVKGREILTYLGGYDEILEDIENILDDKDSLTLIGEQARLRCIKDHGMRKRVDGLIKYLNA